MAGYFEVGGGPFSPLTLFVIVLVLQLIDSYLGRLKKGGARTMEEAKLRNEIRQLLKEASLLSSPSTFAQAAKLKRAAAAKEKELTKMQEEHKKMTESSHNLYTQCILAFKVLFFVFLTWRFWGIPVAALPEHLLQPFGRMLTWQSGLAEPSKIKVGFIPWIVLTSRVSKFLSEKFWRSLQK